MREVVSWGGCSDSKGGGGYFFELFIIDEQNINDDLLLAIFSTSA